jgi:hypothetical protein
MSSRRKKVKKLSLQYSYLRLEEEEVSEICSEVEGEMRSALKEHYPKEFEIFYGPAVKSPAPPVETIEDSEEFLEDSETKEEHVPKNPDVKKLYRHIVKRIHPDKQDGGNEEQFKLAAKAYEENNVATLLEIAAQNNIELTVLSPETIELLKNNIKTLENKINTKKGSSSWYYAQATTPEEKLQILKQIAKYIKENNDA